MQSDVDAAAKPARQGVIRAPQSFFAGLALIALGLFAIWAISNLPQGTLGAMGPAMLPRWLAIAVALCGAALVVFGVIKEGDPVKLPDFSPIATLAAILVVGGAVSWMLSRSGATSATWGTVFTNLFLILFYGVVLGLFVLSFRRRAWLTSTGLRGPLFVMAGILAFAFTIRLFGLAIAGPLALVIGGLGSDETRLKELLVFAVLMTAFCVGLFRYLLNQPMPILIVPGTSIYI